MLNFGATFAYDNNSLSICGSVQVGQAYNKYNNTNIEVIDILSPFRNPEKDENESTSIGTKIVVDEAHYMYPFSVNPQNYAIYKEVLGDIACYTKDAYESFKHGCLVAATAYNTNSKMGCENEFTVFVTCKENSKLYLANLDQYITFTKKESEKDIIDMTKLSDILNAHKEEIENIEVYYNQYTLEIKGIENRYQVSYLF